VRAPPILAELPAGYEVESSARAWLALRRDVAPVLRALGYGPESDVPAVASALTGRKPLLEITAGADVFLVRRFTHGGLLRVLTGARFSDPERPFRELCLADRLQRAGIRTPEVVAARAQAFAGGGYKLEVVTRRVEGAIDLGFVLGMARRGEVEPLVLRRLVRAAGELVARLHAVGCLHADLQPNNVLVQREALAGARPELAILDLDRSHIVAALSDDDRRRNLRRLYRFVARREARDGRTLARSDHARFLVSYRHGDRAWRDDWRAIASAHEAHQGWHAIGWKLEGTFGKSRDPRSGR
jgi:hypothetical protein